MEQHRQLTCMLMASLWGSSGVLKFLPSVEGRRSSSRRLIICIPMRFDVTVSFFPPFPPPFSINLNFISRSRCSLSLQLLQKKKKKGPPIFESRALFSLADSDFLSGSHRRAVTSGASFIQASLAAPRAHLHRRVKCGHAHHTSDMSASACARANVCVRDLHELRLRVRHIRESFSSVTL